MCIKSHRFLCHPYRSWEFHDGIKYQCPGVTVPKCRRFWRVLKYRFALLDHPETGDLMTPAKVHPVHDRHNFCWSTWATLVKIFGAFPPKVWCKTSQQTIDLKPQIYSCNCLDLLKSTLGKKVKKWWAWWVICLGKKVKTITLNKSKEWIIFNCNPRVHGWFQYIQYTNEITRPNILNISFVVSFMTILCVKFQGSPSEKKIENNLYLAPETSTMLKVVFSISWMIQNISILKKQKCLGYQVYIRLNMVTPLKLARVMTLSTPPNQRSTEHLFASIAEGFHFQEAQDTQQRRLDRCVVDAFFFLLNDLSSPFGS